MRLCWHLQNQKRPQSSIFLKFVFREKFQNERGWFCLCSFPCSWDRIAKCGISFWNESPLVFLCEAVTIDSCPQILLWKLNTWGLHPSLPPGLLFSHLTSAFSWLLEARWRSLWLPGCPGPIFGRSQPIPGAQLPSCMAQWCCWKGEMGRYQPEMPQEGAKMLLFHKPQLPPTTSTSSQRRRRSWTGRGIVVLCADRPETFLGLRKIKEKKKTNSLENRCCRPRKITSALHSSVAISWLTTAVSLDRRSIESLHTYSLFFSRLASNHSTKFFFSMLSIVRL